MIKKDKIHYTGQFMNSFNATFNAVFSAREAGKTTVWATNSYKRWKEEKATTIVLRYLINDITDTYVSDLETTINQYLPDDHQIKFKFRKGGVKEGIVDVFIDGYEDTIPLFRFIALSNSISRIKSMALKNCCQIVFDEAILNTRVGEKYPNGLVLRFKEIYNTYLRCCHTGKKFKVYLFGNFYSKYQPLLVDWKVPMSGMKLGDYYYDKKTDVFVECYNLKEELKEFILSRNKLYLFDDSYTRYGFQGQAINDTNFVIVEKQPQNYYLKYVFRINGKYLFLYKWNGTRKTEGFDTGRFWCTSADTYTGARGVFAADLDNLVSGTYLLTTDLKAIFWRLKNSIAGRDITYGSVEAGYLVEMLYSII